nr:hypothetical protein Iba_chr15eCG0340 [Ipomoea batatas]
MQNSDSMKRLTIDSGLSHPPEPQSKNLHFSWFPVHCLIRIDLMFFGESGVAAPAKLTRFLRFEEMVFCCHEMISWSDCGLRFLQPSHQLQPQRVFESVGDIILEMPAQDVEASIEGHYAVKGSKRTGIQPATRESKTDFLVGLSPGGCRQNSDSMKRIDLMFFGESGLAAPAKLTRFLRFEEMVFCCHEMISSSDCGLRFQPSHQLQPQRVFESVGDIILEMPAQDVEATIEGHVKQFCFVGIVNSARMVVD